MKSAEARYQCCRLLDQLLTPDALAPLIGMLDDPDERVRYTALHSLSCDRCKDDVCLPTDGPLLAKALALLAEDPSAHVRAMAIEAVGRSAHTGAGASGRDSPDAPPHPIPVRLSAKGSLVQQPGGTIHQTHVAEIASRRAGVTLIRCPRVGAGQRLRHQGRRSSRKWPTCPGSFFAAPGAAPPAATTRAAATSRSSTLK